MANIAQTVNVLQSVVLTRQAEMLLTPTYHVFEMYRVHQNATLLPSEVECGTCGAEPGLPSLHASASVDDAGRLHVSICNCDPDAEAPLHCELLGMRPERVSGRVLTAGTINAHNTFESAHAVEPRAFQAVRVEGGALQAVLPAKSVVVLEVE